MLKEIAARTKEKTGLTQLHAVDFMDDGSKIELRIDILQEQVCSQTRDCSVDYCYQPYSTNAIELQEFYANT